MPRLETWRGGGITTVVTAPRGGIFPGQAAVVNLSGERREDVVVRSAAALPLVLIAAECPPDTQAEALRHGAARLLEKPINPRELRRIVQALRPETAPA